MKCILGEAMQSFVHHQIKHRKELMPSYAKFLSFFFIMSTTVLYVTGICQEVVIANRVGFLWRSWNVCPRKPEKWGWLRGKVSFNPNQNFMVTSVAGWELKIKEDEQLPDSGLFKKWGKSQSLFDENFVKQHLWLALENTLENENKSEEISSVVRMIWIIEFVQECDPASLQSASYVARLAKDL